jgi:hypothetical protein
MTELAKLMTSVDDRSLNTQKSYKTQYNKLRKLLQKDVGEASEKKLIEIALEQPNRNQQQAMINIAILVRRLDKLSTTKLEDTREKNKNKIQEVVKENNAVLNETLPPYQDLLDYADFLYSTNEWTDYIINYLLIHLQVRNADLVFDVVKLRRDAKDPDKNYIWLTSKKAVFIRNVYKTASTYGRKTNVITDPKFIVAMKRVMACQKFKEDCGTFIPTLSQAGFYIKKASYKQLGEGKIVKIIVNHFRNDLQKLKEISQNRGTSLTTLAESYDIKNL